MYLSWDTRHATFCQLYSMKLENQAFSPADNKIFVKADCRNLCQVFGDLFSSDVNKPASGIVCSYSDKPTDLSSFFSEVLLGCLILQKGLPNHRCHTSPAIDESANYSKHCLSGLLRPTLVICLCSYQFKSELRLSLFKLYNHYQ